MSAAAGTSGYSGTPLPRKLGIRDRHRVAILGPAPTMDDVAPSVEPHDVREGAGIDVLLAFVTEVAALRAGIVGWADAIGVDGSIWVCWPKKSARRVIASDMTEDAVRDVALPMGLVDNKVCAVDDVWSGLRLVWRKELRSAKR